MTPDALARPPTEAATLYAPDPLARLSLALWQHHAAAHFGASLAVLGAKVDDAQRLGERAEFEIALTHTRDAARRARLRVVTLPLRDAASLKTHAELCAQAIGGAGMDALVARAQRIWQCEPIEGSEGGEMVVMAVLALVLLGPVAPRGEHALVGFKGCRTRAMTHGWVCP